MGYDQELDTSPDLEPDEASYYLTVIGSLKWMIELWRIDIITKVSLLSSHIVLPRKGFLDASVYFMAHVGQRFISRLMYDLLYLEIDHNVFYNLDWSEF